MLPSTQDRAIALAREGAASGSVVVARAQGRGRGRGDRRWSSPEGGLYLSVILRPIAAAGALPLAIGAEVVGALAAAYGVRLRLKWPNDLLAIDGAGDRRKLGGILIDLLDDGAGATSAVVGIGLNAHPPAAGFDPTIRPEPVALADLTAAPIDLETLEGTVVGAVLAARRAMAEAEGGRAILARSRGLLYGTGEPVTLDGRAVGTLVGLRDDGALEVHGPDGTVAVLAGDVRVGVGA